MKLSLKSTSPIWGSSSGTSAGLSIKIVLLQWENEDEYGYASD